MNLRCSGLINNQFCRTNRIDEPPAVFVIRADCCAGLVRSLCQKCFYGGRFHKSTKRIVINFLKQQNRTCHIRTGIRGSAWSGCYKVRFYAPIIRWPIIGEGWRNHICWHTVSPGNVVTRANDKRVLGNSTTGQTIKSIGTTIL